MTKRPDINEYLSQFPVVERAEGVIPGALDRDFLAGMEEFANKSAGELGQRESELRLAVGSMANILKQFEIIGAKAGKDRGDRFGVSEMNRLAKLAEVEPLAEFDESDERLFVEKVSPFMERLYRSERFWAEAEKRELDPQVLLESLIHVFRYGEIRQQIHYVGRLRSAAERIVSASTKRMAELQKELNDFE